LYKSQQHQAASEDTMPILLDHIIVPSHDQAGQAQFLGELLGVPWKKEQGHFSPVFVNDTLTLDFGNADDFPVEHYCFHVSDEEFDAIFDRVKAAGLAYGSAPWTTTDMQINTHLGGRGVYWQDPVDHHMWEILTVSYARPDVTIVDNVASFADSSR
jgi:hypothetical protein